MRGPVRPARRAASAQRRPGRGGGCGAAPASAAAAGGDRLPHPDAAAGRAGRPGRRGQHLPPLRFSAGARAGRRPGRLDAQGVPAPHGPRTPGGQVPGDDGARDRAAGAGRGAALRPVSRARPAPGRVAGRDRWPLRPRARPRRSGCRQDPPGDRDRRDGTAAGRRGRELPVLRDVGAACAGPGGGLAAQPRGPVGGGGPRPRLARRGRQADARRELRRARDRTEGDGGRLAAPPLLRGPRAGAAGRGPPDAAGAGQHAVVRPGDAGLHHLLPSARRRQPAPGGRDAARRQPWRGSRARGLDSPHAGHRTAHRDLPRPAGRRRHGAARRGDLRTAPSRRRC